MEEQSHISHLVLSVLSERLRQLCRLFQSSNPDFDVLAFDGILRVLQYAIGGAHPGRRRCGLPSANSRVPLLAANNGPSEPPWISRRICLLVFATRVMNVVTAVTTAKGQTR